MLKVLVLQKYYGLSDEASEEQILDHTSFKNLLGLRIESDRRYGTCKLFEAFRQILENHGLIDHEEIQRIKNGERPAEFEENLPVGR